MPRNSVNGYKGTYAAKSTEEKIAEAKQLHKTGLSCRAVAKRMSISEPTAWAWIAHGKPMSEIEAGDTSALEDNAPTIMDKLIDLAQGLYEADHADARLKRKGLVADKLRRAYTIADAVKHLKASYHTIKVSVSVLGGAGILDSYCTAAGRKHWFLRV